jgi:hypothetical protein
MHILVPCRRMPVSQICTCKFLEFRSWIACRYMHGTCFLPVCTFSCHAQATCTSFLEPNLHLFLPDIACFLHKYSIPDSSPANGLKLLAHIWYFLTYTCPLPNYTCSLPAKTCSRLACLSPHLHTLASYLHKPDSYLHTPVRYLLLLTSCTCFLPAYTCSLPT